MFKTKLIKKLALVVTICSLANVFSFGTGVLAADEDNGVTTYNFDDGVLPEGLDSTMFTVENGMLKVNDKDSVFAVGDMSANYSIEFKIKPFADNVEKAFNLHFGNATIYYDGANGQNSSWDDAVTLKKRADGSQISKLWAKGSYFPDRTNGHTVKAVVNSNMHSFYIDGSLIISGECTEAASSNDISFSLASFATDGVYLDDIVITKMADSAEITTSGALYAYNFNDGVLPARFDSSLFSVENQMLKMTNPSSSFSFTNVPKHSSMELKLKPVDGTVIPKFSLNFGNLSISYDNWASVNGSGSDKIVVYERIGWSTLTTLWADGGGGRPTGSFFPAANGIHTIKVITYGDNHKLYLNDVCVLNQEYSGKMNSYDLSFMLSKSAAYDVYIDDIIVKDSTEPYNYNFDDGVLPEEFDSNNFAVVDKMLYVRGVDSVINFDEMSKNCSFEFKVKPETGSYIPAFYVEWGNSQISYINNAIAYAGNDVIRVYNRTDWSVAKKEVWNSPSGNFLPSADGHTLKFVAKDNIHSIYIDGVLKHESEITGELSAYNIKLGVTDYAGTATSFYLDDIKVNLLDLVPEFTVAVSADGDTKTCNVTLKNIDDENKVIFAGYKGGILVDAQVKDCTNDSEVFTTAADIDKIKVMLWSGTKALTPLYDSIDITQSEWTTVSE